MIKIDNISLSFNQQKVLDNFSLSVEQGAKVAVSGRSGSGKSSVLRCLLGFVVPEQGCIFVDGTKLDGNSIWQARRQIGYVAQEPDLGDGTVREVIDRSFEYKANHTAAGNLGRLGQLMVEFDLNESILAKNITSLSGGEKQRIALIIALLLGRKILLLDEISSALDSKSKSKVLTHIMQTDLTVIFVTHDHDIVSMCGQVVTLEAAGQEAGNE